MDGILIVNKPKQYTSHDVVAKVKKMCHEKVGHTGTLDPMATGVLPLLIGQGTKLSKYIVDHDKIYVAKIQLGKKTDTLDAEGKIIQESNVDTSILTEQNLKNILNNLKGKQIQTPPIYSAIKVNGKKLYEYARKGLEVEIPKREIEIYNIELLKLDISNKTMEFKVHCSKGTYIRTLCETIANELGTIGYMSELNRLRVGQFDICNAITIEQLEQKIKEKNENFQENNNGQMQNTEFINKNIITMQQFFEKYPIINLPKEKLKLFLNGVQLTYKKPDDIYQIQVNNQIIGVGILKNNLLKRDIIF